MFDTFILCHFLLAAIDWASQGSNVFRQVIFDDVRNRGRDSLASENLKKKKGDGCENSQSLCIRAK